MAREEAALGLVREMLGYEGREAAHDAAAAEQRLAVARLDAADADAELARAQAEGPASHRKRDYIDKVPLRFEAGLDRCCPRGLAKHGGPRLAPLAQLHPQGVLFSLFGIRLSQRL